MDSKIKIAMLGTVADFHTHGLGIQRYMHEITKEVMTQNDANARSKMDIRKVECPVYPAIGNGFSLLAWSLLHGLKEFDILHNLQPALLYQSSKKRHSGKIITTVHDYMTLFYRDLIVGDLGNVKGKLWYNLIIKNAELYSLNSDFLIAVSSQTAEEAIKLGFDKKMINVIGQALDGRFFKPIQMKNGGSQFRVGYIGGFNSRKNVAFAIRAFNKIDEDDIAFDVWGKEKYEYSHLVELAEGNKKISFRGFLPEGKLLETYDSFDAFVFPSLYEGFGMPMLEAQSRGIPTIAYKKSMIPEEVKRNCILAEDEAHLAQIIVDLKENGPNKVKVERAMHEARTYSWENIAKETLKVYELLAES